MQFAAVEPFRHLLPTFFTLVHVTLLVYASWQLSLSWTPLHDNGAQRLDVSAHKC